MSSNIDETVPVDNQRVEKAAVRANFSAAKDEIEALQRQVSLAWRIALGVTNMVN